MSAVATQQHNLSANLICFQSTLLFLAFELSRATPTPNKTTGTALCLQTKAFVDMKQTENIEGVTDVQQTLVEVL